MYYTIESDKPQSIVALWQRFFSEIENDRDRYLKIYSFYPWVHR